jgi:nicotinamidase-related amidase
MRVGGQRHARLLYAQERDPVPIVHEAVWAPGSVWTGAENLAPQPGFDPRTVQPVASRYTDWAIAAYIRVLYVG